MSLRLIMPWFVIWTCVAEQGAPQRAATKAGPLHLADVVNRAIEQYPALDLLRLEISAAAAQINLSRTSYLPRVEGIVQGSRATHNHVIGMVVPQPVAATVAGSIPEASELGGLWESLAGVLVTWEPFDFGLREATIASLASSVHRAEARLERTRLEIATAAADAFLTMVAAQQTIQAGEEALERAQMLDQEVGSLVNSGLRSAADAICSRTEIELARTQVMEAKKAEAVARGALAQMLGMEVRAVHIDAGALLEIAQDLQPGAARPTQHPIAREQNAAIEESRARERVLDRSLYPRLQVQGARYARGSGARSDTLNLAGLRGMRPQNWAVGASLSFPMHEISSIRARREIEAYRGRAEQARYRHVIQELTGRLEKARALLRSADRIAHDLPSRLETARAAERRAFAEYRNGLLSIADVTLAQRLLTQTEIDEVLARLNVWRARLGLAAAEGDLQPILAAGSRR